MRVNCPKCANPVAPDAAFCGVCTEVLVKKAAPAAAPALPLPPAAAPQKTEWTPAAMIAAAALAALLVPFRARILDWTWLIDFVNLAFHEGGHLVFGALGLGNRFIMVCGGTAMQLLIPGACAVQFWRRGERASASACLLWFGQNFLGIGKYAADARAQQLDLVAGGVHDWTYLLEILGLLIHDEGIGRLIQILGCLVMAAAAVGVYVYFPRGRAAEA